MLLMYVVHLCLKFTAAPVPSFFSRYFADLLCMPLMLSMIALAMRRVLHRPDFCLSVGMVFFAMVYTAVVFEWLLPRLNERYVADPLDVWMYGMGSLVFIVFQKRLLRA
jgi:ribose/xylose/arabinose/galactoside ABC-type transport system permease subunit